MKRFEIGCTLQKCGPLILAFTGYGAQAVWFTLFWLASFAVPLHATESSTSPLQPHLDAHASVQQLSASWEPVGHKKPLLAVILPEPQGSGRTAAEHRMSDRNRTRLFTVFILAFLLLFVVPAFLRGLVPTGRRRYRRHDGWAIHSGGLSGAGRRGERPGNRSFFGGGAGGDW